MQWYNNNIEICYEIRHLTPICNIRFQHPFPTFVPWEIHEFVRLQRIFGSNFLCWQLNNFEILKQGEKKQDCKCFQSHRLHKEWQNSSMTTTWQLQKTITRSAELECSHLKSSRHSNLLIHWAKIEWTTKIFQKSSKMTVFWYHIIILNFRIGLFRSTKVLFCYQFQFCKLPAPSTIE